MKQAVGRPYDMKTALAFCFLLLASCGPTEISPVVVTTPAQAEVAQPIDSGKRPLCVTWGMTQAEVIAMAGQPDWTGVESAGNPAIYGDVVWRYDVPSCGAWFVWFDRVVTARFGWAGGCLPDPSC